MSDTNRIINCARCGVSFHPRRKNENPMYCSRFCFHADRSDRLSTSHIRFNCAWCGIEVEVHPSDNDQRFCGLSCAGKWKSKNTNITTRAYELSLRERTCVVCGDQFTPVSIRQEACKTCIPDKGSRTRYRRYGVSKPEVDALRAAQDNKCAICGKPDPNMLDHDHRTKKPRGLLCGSCNIGLGHIERSDWLERSLTYIRNHTEDRDGKKDD
jgi:hypothetical protein